MTTHAVQFNRPLKSITIEGRQASVCETVFDVFGHEPEEAGPEDRSLTRDDLESVLNVLDDLHNFISEHEARRRQSMNELQQLAIEIGFAVAEKLVRGKIERDEFPIEEMIREVVSRAEPNASLDLYLNPLDLELITEAQSLREDPNAKSIQFRADPTLGRGSCRANCGTYDIVSQIELELAELRYHLLGNLDDAQTERRHADPADSELRQFPDRRSPH